MAQFLLSVHSTETTPAHDEAEMGRLYQQVEAVNAELKAAGAWVFAGGLHPASSATVVSLRHGEVVTLDGPHTEAVENLSGFWIIEAADLEAALAWAAKATVACEGPVEVRAFQEEPEG